MICLLIIALGDSLLRYLVCFRLVVWVALLFDYLVLCCVVAFCCAVFGVCGDFGLCLT